MNTIKNEKGGTAYDHSGAHAVEMFSKAGSLFANKQVSTDTTALALFQNVWRGGDSITAMKLLFWLRDPRGGAGNRSGFRSCVEWLANEAPEWVTANAELIPQYGRWDDMTSLYVNDETADVASTLWAKALLSDDALAAKWSKREDKRVLKTLKKISDGKVVNEASFRKLLSKLRKDVVEVALASNEVSRIDYSKVPSVAMARYSATFERKDSERFQAYKAELEKVLDGESNSKVKMNASVLFPHECIRTILNGDVKTGNLQFKSLPNFMEESGSRVMVIADSSGSMSCRIGGPNSSVQAVDVSTALALYCSDRVGKDNPFYRKYMKFCSEGTLVDWTDKDNISEVLRDRNMFDGAVGTTDITKALNTLVKYGKMFNATNEQMPTHLVIVSDMQFDGDGYNCGTTPNSRDKAVVEKALKKFDDAGFERPNIIYWNTRGAEGSPSTARTPNTALVSGFSPSILKAIFGNPESMNPVNIMQEAIKDYQVIVPQ